MRRSLGWTDSAGKPAPPPSRQNLAILHPTHVKGVTVVIDRDGLTFMRSARSARSPQALQQLAHVRRQRRFESHQFAAARMPEREAVRVKRLTRELDRPEKIGTVR